MSHTVTSKRLTSSVTARAAVQVSLLILLDILLILLLPANRATMHAYGFSSLEYRVVLFAVSLPVMVVWLAAFIGYAHLKQYAGIMSKTNEGAYFDRLATGCSWLAWSLPVSAIVSLTLGAATNQWPSFYPKAVIMSNYLNLILPLVAFSIIGEASRGLINYAKVRLSLANTRSVIVLFLLIGVFYCYLTFKHFNLTSLASSSNSYYLPVWLLVVSVIIPYLYAWFSGILAAYEINLFNQQANGVIYRKALRLLVAGLLIIIISFIAIQYLNSLHPDIGRLALNYQMALILSFRVISGIGFALMTIGALQLKKIEEI